GLRLAAANAAGRGAERPSRPGSGDNVSALDMVDLHDVRYVRRAAGTLRAFNEAGVLAAADIHVALRLAQLAEEKDQDTLLATALAVRAPRRGSVCVDLATIAAKIGRAH